MDASELLQVLGADYTVKILQATQDPRTAPELSDDLGIPIATTYRRLNALTDAGLVREVSRNDANTDSTPTAYQRTVENLRVEFESDTINVTVQDRHPVYPRLQEIWRGLTR